MGWHNYQLTGGRFANKHEQVAKDERQAIFGQTVEGRAGDQKKAGHKNEIKDDLAL